MYLEILVVFLVLINQVYCLFTLKSSQHLTGGGDFSTVNRILNPLKIPLNLEIEPKEVTDSFVGSVTAVIGNNGECRNLAINPGGDVLITGEFKEPRFVGGSLFPFEVYEIEARASLLQYTCRIPLTLESSGVIDVFVGSGGDGFLEFTSTQTFISQKIEFFSQDFTQLPPSISIPGDCFADPVELIYNGEGIASIVGVDATNLVISQVEDDETLVFDEISNELCVLINEFAIELGVLAINNDLIDPESDFNIGNPFVPDTNGVISALESEKELIESIGNRTNNLLNFTDKDDFFVDLIVPQDPQTENFITDLLEAISTNENEDIDPILSFLADVLDLNVEEDGSLLDFDVISLLDGSLFDSAGIGNEVDLSFELEEKITKPDSITGIEQDIFTLLFSGNIVSVLVSIFPPNSSILPAFQVIDEGFFTLLLDGINFNDIIVKATLDLVLNLKNIGIEDPDLFFLLEPFDETIEETLDIVVDWKGFIAALSVLLAIDFDLVEAIEIGPLLEFIFDCALSTFVLTPTITGATVQHETVEASLSQLNDAIAVLAADIVEVFLPMYQIVVPRALELIIADAVSNTQLIEETECPLTDEQFDNFEEFPQDFSKGIFNEVRLNINENTVNDFVGSIEIEESEVVFIGDPLIESDGFGFTIPFPEDENGAIQNASIFFERIAFSGIFPPHINELDIFNVIEESRFAPQELRNTLSVGRSQDPIKVNLVIGVTVTEPEPFRDVIDVTLDIEEVNVLLDILFSYSDFDVNATQLGEILNIGCWTEKLDFPGGITALKFVLRNLEASGNCDCSNEFVNSVFNAFISDPGKEELLEFIDQGMNGIGLLMENLFSPERFSGTLRDAGILCETNDLGIFTDIPDIKVEKPAFAFGVVLPLMAFFAFAVILPGIVAYLMTRYSPKGISKKKLNIESNNKMLSHILRQEEDEEYLEHLHLTKTMSRNPSISVYTRILIPISLIVNVGLFIIGDTGDAVVINIVGDIIGLPYVDNGFAKLSIISSVIELYKSGGVVLAILLFMLSIFWPYLKLFLMTFCWFAPISVISLHKRGKLIEILDILGRFSFAEFHFLVFVLVVFQIEGASPKVSFLPEEPVFQLGLEIVPLISLFTFALAVVVSILISNTMLVCQHHIENLSRLKLREKHLIELNRENNNTNLLNNALDKDNEAHHLTTWSFTVHEKDENNAVLYSYTYKITRKAVLIYAGAVIFAALSLLVAAFVPTISISFSGFFSYLIEFAGLEKEFDLSVFDLLYKVNESYENNFIIYFVSAVFILTVTVIPMLQTIVLMTLLFKSVSVHTARTLTEAHHVITVWCCVDVFVLAITLTVLELPSVAAGFVSSLEFCDTLTGVIDAVLVPMEFMVPEDAESGCIGIASSISSGGYAAVLSVLFLSIANLIVSRIFYFYIADREKVIEATERANRDRRNSLVSVADETNVKPFHLELRRVGLIKIDLAGVKKKMAKNTTNTQTPANVGSLSAWVRNRRRDILEPDNVATRTEQQSREPQYGDDPLPVVGVYQSPTQIERPRKPSVEVVNTARDYASVNEPYAQGSTHTTRNIPWPVTDDDLDNVDF